jgi:hypothetical protein
MNPKESLLQAIAGKNRGLLVNEKDKVKILSLVEQLEDHNPTPNPVEAKELLQGDWRLLYTTSKSILGLDRFPLLQLGEIYQCIRVEAGKLYNLAEIVGIPFLEGLVSVAASFQVVSPKRVDVKFERSILGLQRFLDYLSPKDFINQIEAGKKFPLFDFPIGERPQNAWLEITYLDGDLRIGRGNEGNIFVLAKETK